MTKLALFGTLILFLLAALLTACEPQGGGYSPSAEPASATQNLTTQTPVSTERMGANGDPGHRGDPGYRGFSNSQSAGQQRSDYGTFGGPGGTKVGPIPPSTGGGGRRRRP